ncbi:MAG: hypothetical protein LBG67_03540 [Campylobacteraceae bacterium]|jgi:hypothetical protein|nr:hypothetical protein [Campylobacteraceae bacterium]
MSKIWTTEVNRQTIAKKEQIWKLWADVANWNSWDNDIESSELYGKFIVGTKGMLKSVGGPKTTFVITDCEYLKSFTNRSYLPLCKIDFIHTLSEMKNRLVVTHRVEMSGFLTFFFSKVIGKNVAKGLPQAVENLITNAEKFE